MWQEFSVDHVIIQLSLVRFNGEIVAFSVSFFGASESFLLVCSFEDGFLEVLLFCFIRCADRMFSTVKYHTNISEEGDRKSVDIEKSRAGEPRKCFPFDVTFDHKFNRFLRAVPVDRYWWKRKK